ncbi:FtsX-like permease family protein [Salinibacterium sp.]|uniref:ABC transporter permease n=1 Tax=Salinibacterium sp. TaxID=1915057 RepID=UPI002869F790|nr:FtsX-like permease family protein [Salinibacterium sp.]
MNGFTVREHIPSILVATLSSAFGVSLLQVTTNLSILIAADDVTGASGTVQFILAIIAFVFIVIATYVGSIVTANTFATIIAGRTRTIALMRIIGVTAASQRRVVANEGLTVGIIGAISGLVLGTLATAVLIMVSVRTGFIPSLAYTFLEPIVLIPIFGVLLTTWFASRVGSRRVLTVSPMQATGAAIEESQEQAAGHRGRNAVAIVLFAFGTVILGLGVVVGLVSPAGVMIGVLGGILSFTGLVLGAQLVMPPALTLVGRMLGASPSAKLAAQNAVRYPERSSRTTIGLVIGVTLVTMFAVATAGFQQMVDIARANEPAVYEGIDQVLTITVVVFSVLIGFSALIAAVGMVNNLSLSVLQRTRELGLLRALGFTARQLRAMIRAESAQLVIASVLVGFTLGIAYGWAGAQSMLGSMNGSPGLILPVVPLWLLGVVVIVAAVLTVAASIIPARRATRITPIVALAVD